MDFSGIFGFIASMFEGLPNIRLILAFILVFLVPGCAWALVFFNKLSIIERIALYHPGDLFCQEVFKQTVAPGYTSA